MNYAITTGHAGETRLSSHGHLLPATLLCLAFAVGVSAEEPRRSPSSHRAKVDGSLMQALQVDSLLRSRRRSSARARKGASTTEKARSRAAQIDVTVHFSRQFSAAEVRSLEAGGVVFVRLSACPTVAWRMSTASTRHGSARKSSSGSRRTSIVQVGGKWRAVVDRPKPVVKHFNAANIIAGTISVADVPASQRASRITGSFNNSENDWEITPYPLEADGIAPSDGFVNESKRLLGTTKPYQAAWVLNRDILQNQYQLRRAEFEATVGAIALQVGDIFGLSPPDVGTAVATGHVLGVSASQRTVHVDDDLELDPSETYFVVIEHQADQHIEQKALTGVSGAPTHLVQVASDWEYTLREGDRYSILSTPLELYRCIAIDTANDLNRKIVGVLYDERAYVDQVPNMTPDAPRGGEPLGVFPSAVPDLVLGFRSPQPVTAGPNTVTRNTIDVEWGVPTQGIVERYEVFLRRNGAATWRRVGGTAGTRFETSSDIRLGRTYDIAVVPVTTRGTRGRVDDATRGTILAS